MYTPSLEETVRNEFKNMKSVEVRNNQVRRRTLTNLQGVYAIVASEYGNQNLYKQNLLDTDQVRTDLELKLRYAGINVLSKEQFLRTRGRPSLIVNAFVLPSQFGDSFIAAVKSLELYEQVSLERIPDVTLYLSTWEDFGKCSGKDELTEAVRIARQEIKSLVEHFADDYYSVNPVPPKEALRLEVQSTFIEAGDKYSSVPLKGLTGIHVPQLYGSDIPVMTTIIPQLEKAGITVLSSEKWNAGEYGHYPKKPYLFLYASPLGDDPQCFKLVFPLQLIERVILVRNPEIIRELPVWESKSRITIGDMRNKNEVLMEIRQDVQDMVEEFINAYLSVKSKDN